MIKIPDAPLETESQNETHAYRLLWAPFSFIQLAVAYYVLANGEYARPIYWANRGIFYKPTVFSC